tara:strand:- start:48 stop:677 length:630 start_codon:yes stop_codon:yes gene_type:complete
MDSLDEPLLVSSALQIHETSPIFYQILHIADVSTWYHRQALDELEFLLCEISGYEINSLVSKKLNLFIEDTLNVYLVMKNYIHNGGCQTKTHIMITKNFDVFDDLNELNRDLYLKDLLSIQDDKNKEDMNMLFMFNFSSNESFLKFNLLNYEVNIYKYLNQLICLDKKFVNIRIYDIYENDVTHIVIEKIKLIDEIKYKNKISNYNTII